MLRRTPPYLHLWRSRADDETDEVVEPITTEVANSSISSAMEEANMPYEPLDLSFLSFLMTPTMEAAIEEMKQLIAAKYPDASFEVDYGEEPLGVHLFATFEHDDLGEVLDHFIDR